VIPVREEISSRWVQIALQTPLVRSIIDSRLNTTVQATLNLRDVAQLPILIPPKRERLAITSILGSLDDKIELNRQMNETLEGIAKAIFKSWFVDFDPVRAKAEGRNTGLPKHIADLFPDSFVDSELGEIPKGWKATALEDAIEIHDSKRIPLSNRERAERQGPYPYYGAASVMDHVDGYLFDGIYILVGEDGSVVNDEDSPVIQYAWGKFWVNNHAHVLTGRNEISIPHLMLFFRQINIRPFITGAVQPKLNQANLRRIPFVLPPKLICRTFTSQIENFFSCIRNGTDESRNLVALRDTLLPMLISGEIRVNGAERLVEEQIK
jgi:type I restriction enzyme, S subunit